MRKWVVGTVVAVVAALFGMPAAAIASPPDRAVHPTYAYNSPEYDAPGNDAVPERAPPARGLDFIAQDAVGQRLPWILGAGREGYDNDGVASSGT